MPHLMTQSLPVLPLRDIVVFPHMVVPLFVGRDKSVAALEHAMKAERLVLMVTQKNANTDNPSLEDLYRVGTVGKVLQMFKLPDGTVKVLVEGMVRAQFDKFLPHDDFYEADIELLEEADAASDELKKLGRTVLGEFEEYVKLNKKIPPEILIAINQIDDTAKLADTIAAHLSMKLEEKQALLEITTTAERLERIFAAIEGEVGVLKVEKKVKSRVKQQMEKNQREYYLNEQMKAIQKELHEDEKGYSEIEELEKKIAATKLSKEARDKTLGEVKKLKQMSAMAAEATVIRNYLDWVLGIPWNKRSKTKRDLKEAQKILDADHYGLEKVKERILEYLAVQVRAQKVRGPILCLVGSPGVGKTSLGQSIAKATNRNFVRVALGGVRDESEIRGHRRTYIGSMPGRVIQGMKKAKTSNPLFLFDEIDKLGNDYRGDPSSALLEVLDPEQNSKFNDHYLEVDYDLSDVMFICTANSLNIPHALRDRMEIIHLSGYTEEEKLEIAQRHLLKKQMEAAGLKKGEFAINEEALKLLIRYYTREAGVRNLEREISKLCRKAVKEIVMGKRERVAITAKNLDHYAGVRKHRYGIMEEENRVGVVNGLAYTETGGDLLPIEAVTMPGKDGKVTYTGNLQDVMKESIVVAEMLIKSRAHLYGIDHEDLAKKSIHVHVPEGAVPKDGPSAGAAMVTAIVSALTGIPIRRDIAMTGEVNLRGRVTAIGGLKEKLLSALRAGITQAIIPEENVKDLVDLPAVIKKKMKISPVERIDEVLMIALERVPQPIDLSKKSVVFESDSKPEATETVSSGVITH